MAQEIRTSIGVLDTNVSRFLDENLQIEDDDLADNIILNKVKSLCEELQAVITDYQSIKGWI